MVSPLHFDGAFEGRSPTIVNPNKMTHPKAIVLSHSWLEYTLVFKWFYWQDTCGAVGAFWTLNPCHLPYKRCGNMKNVVLWMASDSTCTSTVLPVSPPGVKMAIKSKQAEHYFLYINVLGKLYRYMTWRKFAIYSGRLLEKRSHNSHIFDEYRPL